MDGRLATLRPFNSISVISGLSEADNEKLYYTSDGCAYITSRDACVDCDMYFSNIGQEYPFLQVSEIFLSRPAISAQALKAVSICQALLNIAQSCSFQPLNLLLAM